MVGRERSGGGQVFARDVSCEAWGGGGRVGCGGEEEESLDRQVSLDERGDSSHCTDPVHVMTGVIPESSFFKEHGVHAALPTLAISQQTVPRSTPFPGGRSQETVQVDNTSRRQLRNGKSFYREDLVTEPTLTTASPSCKATFSCRYGGILD